MYKTKSFADRLQEAAEEHEKEEVKFRRDDKLSIEDMVKYINSVGKRGIYDEFHCVNTIPPQGKFDASRLVLFAFESPASSRFPMPTCILSDTPEKFFKLDAVGELFSIEFRNMSIQILKTLICVSLYTDIVLSPPKLP